MKVVGFGDLLLRLGPVGYRRFTQADTLEVNYTGAEANVCVALANWGVDAHVVTRVPQHEIGQSAVNMLRRFGVQTAGIVRGGDRIGVYYIEKGASQRASKVIYDRKNSGICEAKPSDFDWPTLLDGADFFHFTGITAALSKTMPDILLDALTTAKEKGVTVSCDLNYRKNLWSQQEAKRVMEKLVPYVDVLIANEEDADKVLGIRADDCDVTSGKLDRKGYIKVAQKLCNAYGMGKVAISLRKSISASDNMWSIMLYADGEAHFSKEYAVHIVDRVGGGDAFAAGLIYGMGNDFAPQKTVEFAAAASCLKHSIEMDFNLVSLSEVEALMAGDGSGRVVR